MGLHHIELTSIDNCDNSNKSAEITNNISTINFSYDDDDDDDSATIVTITSLSSQQQQQNHDSDDNDNTFLKMTTSSSSSSQHQTTPFQSYLHLLKGNIGPGCLSLPYAYSILGIEWGIIVTITLCLLTSYNALLMVRLKRELLALEEEEGGGSEGGGGGRRRVRRYGSDLSYSDLGSILYSPRFRLFITLSILLQQLSVCTVFFSFIGENMAAVMAQSFFDIDPRWIMTLMLPMALLLSCVPHLKALAPISALATVLLFIGFGLVVVVVGDNARGGSGGGGGGDIMTDDDTTTGSSSSITEHSYSLSHIPLAICAIMYSFEGICLVFPVESSISSPSQFPKTYIYAMTTVCLVYIFVATGIVLVFGRSIDDGSLTAYLIDHLEGLGGGVGAVYAANAVLSVSVLLTYPLQMFPCIGLVGQALTMRGGRGGWRPLSSVEEEESGEGRGSDGSDDDGVVLTTTTMNEYSDDDDDDNDDDTTYLSNFDLSPTCPTTAAAPSSTSLLPTPTPSNTSDIPGDSPLIRTLLVLSTYLVALLVPNVKELISLAGALSGSSTALIIPPLLERRRDDVVFSKEKQQQQHPLSRWRRRCRNVMIHLFLIIGVVLGVVGTVASLVDIIKLYG